MNGGAAKTSVNWTLFDGEAEKDRLGCWWERLRRWDGREMNLVRALHVACAALVANMASPVRSRDDKHVRVECK
jgi:hypothetical protein